MEQHEIAYFTAEQQESLLFMSAAIGLSIPSALMRALEYFAEKRADECPRFETGLVIP